MVLNQIERLKKDYVDMENYIKRLQRRGENEKAQRIMEKQIFLNQRIGIVQTH